MVETVPVRITRGCLAALPSDLHRIFARKLIASGEWELVDDDEINDRRGCGMKRVRESVCSGCGGTVRDRDFYDLDNRDNQTGAPTCTCPTAPTAPGSR
ncbi:hypothetical protein DSECCO2_413040 [anaerobic digester metagenome]